MKSIAKMQNTDRPGPLPTEPPPIFHFFYTHLYIHTITYT